MWVGVDEVGQDMFTAEVRFDSIPPSTSAAAVFGKEKRYTHLRLETAIHHPTYLSEFGSGALWVSARPLPYHFAHTVQRFTMHLPQAQGRSCLGGLRSEE